MKLTKKSRVLAVFAITCLCIAIFGVRYHFQAPSLEETIWGEKIDCRDFEPIVNSYVMKRLKQVDQSGPARYLGPTLPAFSRYEHSLGVFAILKKAGSSKKELAAGLLHDASHTVFSHVGDYIWAKNINDYSQESFQDRIHLSYLHQNKIDSALKQMGMSLGDIDIDKNDYKALEQKLPDMCADRIQYNIHTGVILGRISKKDAKQIMDDLKFDEEKWFFSDPKIAAKFANLSLDFTQNFWGAKWNVSMNIHFAQALKRALALNIITTKDLFSTDRIVMNKLIKNQDHLIQLNLQQCKNPTEKISGQKYRSEIFHPKFRGIDPLIKTENGGFKRLSDFDSDFKNKYESVKKWCEVGFEMDILIA